MRYHDRIYGTVEIGEPVLIELWEAEAVRRLRGVLQHGITSLLGITRATTRFEHSVGVMLLVRRLGASLEEQVAALLHDVSHTAFSHVIDYVFGGHDSQSYHEEMKETYLAGAELPTLLAHHGYDWRDFLHDDNYPLLEQPAPALCADRLDYFLRDSLDLGLATAGEIQSALDHLVVHERRIAVDDVAIARWLGYTYLAADQASWANFREVGLYELTARAIRTGLDIGAIDERDIWGADDQLWAKLHAHPDSALQDQLRLISPETQFVWDEIAPTFRVSTKLRTIDPDVIVNGYAQRLSALDPDFGRYRSDYLQSKQGKWPMRVVPPPKK
ncbi:MAG TPA: HD domain-containing protein [Anaerolineae bacterium]|nr:HD domain-containing protein [Anaerolineae bacterium]